jgi:hypothetical protein
VAASCPPGRDGCSRPQILHVVFAIILPVHALDGCAWGLTAVGFARRGGRPVETADIIIPVERYALVYQVPVRLRDRGGQGPGNRDAEDSPVTVEAAI